MKDQKDYCPTCNDTVNVREVSKCWGAEWRCLVCGTVTDQDIDDDNSDYGGYLDDDPEED